MSPSREDPAPADPLEPVLHEAEDELRRRLRDACEADARGVSTDSSVEIRRLEDALLRAAAAAEETLRLRRHIAQRKERSSEAAESDAAEPDAEGGVQPAAESTRRRAGGYPERVAEIASESSTVREFRDAQGQLWRAWPVTPGQSRAGRYLGEYHKGWICFEALEGSARRRLPHQAPHWAELQDADLARLLEQAISAPERPQRPQSGGGPEPLT